MNFISNIYKKLKFKSQHAKLLAKLITDYYALYSIGKIENKQMYDKIARE